MASVQPDGAPPAHELAERLKHATETLEAVVRDRGLLVALSVEERTRLLTAAGDVFNPDAVQRRQWGKANRRASSLLGSSRTRRCWRGRASAPSASGRSTRRRT